MATESGKVGAAVRPVFLMTNRIKGIKIGGPRDDVHGKGKPTESPLACPIKAKSLSKRLQ
jgi:hypothetical protein